MLLKHFNIKTPGTQPPKEVGWEKLWSGYYYMTKCYSELKREVEAEKNRATGAEGTMNFGEFQQDCLLSVLTLQAKALVQVRGAGSLRECLRKVA